MKYSFAHGKYTVEFEESTGKITSLRHGEPWRDLQGDNLILAMLMEIDNLKQLDGFEAGFHAGWMHRHCDTDADEGTTAEDAYSEFLSCRD